MRRNNRMNPTMIEMMEMLGIIPGMEDCTSPPPPMKSLNHFLVEAQLVGERARANHFAGIIEMLIENNDRLVAEIASRDELLAEAAKEERENATIVARLEKRLAKAERVQTGMKKSLAGVKGALKSAKQERDAGKALFRSLEKILLESNGDATETLRKLKEAIGTPLATETSEKDDPETAAE
jgi:hypothetical protein